MALSVSDLTRSIAFYRTFGFRPTPQYVSPNGNFEIVHLRLDNMILELFHFNEHLSAPRNATDVATDLPVLGSKHFGLCVASLFEARRTLEAVGHTCSPTTRGLTGMDYFFVQDPDGIWIEIVQDERVLE